MNWTKVFILNLFILTSLLARSQEVNYFTSTPIVIRGIPNKINFSNNLNLDSLIVFSDLDKDVICIDNKQLYWQTFQGYQRKLFIADIAQGDTIVRDTLDFIILNIDFDDLHFRTVKNRFHSGLTIATDTNKIEYISSKLEQQFDIEKYLKINKMSIRVVAEEDKLPKIDTVINFNSDQFYIWPIIKDIPKNDQIYMELKSIEFSLQNLPCKTPTKTWSVRFKKEKLIPIAPY